MNDVVFQKTIGNVRKHRDTKLVINERKMFKKIDTSNYTVKRPLFQKKKKNRKMIGLMKDESNKGNMASIILI